MIRVRLQSTTAADIQATDDFKLQWAKMTGAETLCDTYADTNYSASNQALYVDVVGKGQSFLGNGSQLTRAGLYLGRSGSPDGTLVAHLYAHTGTYGTNGVPTGSPLATSTTIKNCSSIASGAHWEYFDFDGAVTLTNGTPYFIVVASTNTGSLSNNIGVGQDNTSPTHGATRLP